MHDPCERAPEGLLDKVAFRDTVEGMSNPSSARKMLAGLLVAAVVAVVGIGVAVNRPSVQVSGSVQVWGASLRACGLDDSNLIPCVHRAWLEAYETESMNAFYQALDTETAASGLLSTACHAAGHEAGRSALTDPSQAARIVQFSGTASGACNNGFLHGALDKFAHLNPSEEQFAEVVAACETTGDGMVRSACNDGIGHATWQFTTDVAAATRLCLRFKGEHDRDVCAAGIVMQMNRVDSFTKAEPVLPSDRLMAELPGVCKKMVDAGATASMNDYCYRESVLPISEYINELALPLLIPGADRSDALVLPIARKVADALSRCEVFIEKYSTGCKQSVAHSITWVVGDDAELRERFCQFMPSPYLEICRTTRTR